MAELRLEFHLPQFLLPEDWAPEGEEEVGNPTDKLGAPSVSQGSLLGEDTLSCFSMDLCSCMDVSSEPFPCLADELEQQAKALEREWYCPEEPLVVAPTRFLSASLLGLSSAAPALKHSSLHLRQQQLGELEVVKEKEMVCQGSGDACGAEECEEEEEESIPPSTPTKRSQGHNSSWNESQCTVVVVAADPQEVQSPARPPAMLAPPPHLPVQRLASLSLAVNNAQSIRLRGQPLTAAAWRGCTKNPWCNREVRHRGPCNHRAAVPGLLAYSQRQLFESGVNVEELCRAPELAAGSGAMPNFCNSAQSAPASSAGVEGSPLLTKRKADFDSDICGEAFPYPCPFPFISAPAHLACQQQQEEQQQQPAANQRASSSCPAGEPAGPDTLSGHSQQGSREAERSSSECGQPQQRQQELSAERPKRQRMADGMACEAAECAGSEVAQQGSSGFIRPSEAGDAAELQRQASVDNSPSTDATLTPAAAAEPLAAEAAGPTPAAAAAAALAAPAARTGLRSKAGGRFGSRARRASPTTAGAPGTVGQPGVAQMQSPTPASRGASKSSTPSKQPSRQLPKTPDAATPGVRTNQRRVILQWNADQVTDPRSGKVVCHVDPATFCTQCFVTHTPVWRAGPFGVKTLCNACGVRYMKYVGKNRK